MSLDNPERPVGGLSVRRPPGVELRPLGRDDFNVALALSRELYRLPDTDPAPHRAAFDRYVNNPDAAPFLAVADGQPAGLVLFSFRRRLNRATFEGWVSDLVVHGPLRGRGIGRALLSAAVEEWRLRGGHDFVLEAGDDRSVARQLYSRIGLEERERLWELVPLRPFRGSAPVTVRPTLAGDVDVITRLLAELGRPVPTPERVPAVQRSFAELMRSHDRRSFVAEADGIAVGVVVAELRRPFYLLQPQLWVSELVVTEPARGRGVGRRLLATVLEAAEESRAYGATLTAAATRPAAERLFRTAGFVDVGASFALAGR